MRYRDNPTVEVEQRVSGDPAAIWALVTDITLPARCSAELQEVAWMSSPAKRLSVRMLRARDLVGVNILTSPPLSPLHNLILRWFADARLPTPTLSTCNNVAITARLVARGVAMSALPVEAVRAELRAGTLIRYVQRVPFDRVELCAAYPSSSRSAGIEAVIRIARQVISASKLGRGD